ncbi:MAG: helix-turn-helix transcriptional regulator [Actinomycetia bacterium]|nr:helix-turn-helix transcriptional regulator [Actinomycetes bacterium]MCP5033744.1 helix-turn-helix transcriptional regulator [Actinomycetes bacterium]
MYDRRLANTESPGPEGPVGLGSRGPGRSRRRGPGRHGRGRRRNRVSRGEVRNAVLALLAEEPMHGYQVMQELEERSRGAWQPSPGSIYPTLQLMADEGLVVSESSEGKNVFSLTEQGREAARSIEQGPVWERFADEGASGPHALHRAMFQVGAAVKQVAVTGSPTQLEAANVILADTRKALYRLLAEDEDE